MAKRRYEVLFILDAETDAAAHRAANSAWVAADASAKVTMVEAMARERKADDRLGEVTWQDWSDTPDTTFSVHYER